MTTESPPAFAPTSIELQSITDSKIIAVSLYSSRAEITRLYKFAVQTGQNQVNISNLPNVLEAESLRVEGRGAATIHDVTLSMAKEDVPKSSPKLEELLITRENTSNALTRCAEAQSALKQYVGSLNVQTLAVSQLESVLEQHESTGARLDARKGELTRELQRIDAEIATERKRIAVPLEHSKLRNKAAIGVFAQNAGNVEIALIYAVPFASWTAFYDIRVDMDTKESPVTLIYKAGVKQNTGESWDNVPLQLETSTPTFGLGVPKLSTWNVDIYRPQPVSVYAQQVPTTWARPTTVPIIIQDSRRHSRSRSRSYSRRSRSRSRSESSDQEPEMAIEEAAVTSTGNVSATFRVPGLVTIPCDNAAHNFTIVELRPKATMSWVAVPKREAKTHLTAHITNASEYTLLSGTASVYVDGSFIARSAVPTVSPQESFDCPLGLDPSIRITYHPIIKKISQSGFYKKSATHGFVQRITLHNTKSVAVERLRIVDQIPASRNAQIKVKLVHPALALGEGTVANPNANNAKVGAGAESVKVGAGVVAQWDGGDEQDRRVAWVCTVPAQGKVSLTLEWTVTVSPADARVIGL
ncbi:hypothetical protein B0H19DRAFT_923139 [Mycena capillaripes]|nr:hypothetical protein B0H19DRAFT_923139 [Mycena capillaripes]